MKQTPEQASDLHCMYCHSPLGLSIRFLVLRATKPKFYPNRWKQIGECCESCEAAGEKMRYEMGELIPEEPTA